MAEFVFHSYRGFINSRSIYPWFERYAVFGASQISSVSGTCGV